MGYRGISTSQQVKDGIIKAVDVDATEIQTTSEKDQPNGYAGLDADGQLPAVVIHRNGTTTEIDDIILSQGELAICNDTGEVRRGDGETEGGIGLGSGVAEVSDPADGDVLQHHNASVLYVTRFSYNPVEEIRTVTLADGEFSGQTLEVYMSIHVDLYDPPPGDHRATLKLSFPGPGLSYACANGGTTQAVVRTVSAMWDGSAWIPIPKPIKYECTRTLSNDSSSILLPRTNFGLPYLVTASTAMSVRCQVAGYNSTDGLVAAYSITGAAKLDSSGTLSLIGTPDVIAHEEGTMSGCDCTLALYGNAIVPEVTGLAGKTINWRGVVEIVEVVSWPT